MAEPIDLGNDPPLPVGGDGSGLVDRRRISVRWLSGAILTGLCGAALMGGAVFASLDGETNFAVAPEPLETALRGTLPNLSGHLAGLHKTNRLPTLSELSVDREVLRVSTITLRGNRELVRVLPYTRVSGDLSLTVSPEVAAQIPPFNPQKLLAAAVTGDDQAAAPQPDSEVSFSTCDFVRPPPRTKVTSAVCEINSLLPKVKLSTLLPLDQVMARVRAVARNTGIGTPLLASADNASALKLGYAPDSDPDAYYSFTARIVPENVTLLPETATQPAARDGSERIITASSGATVGSILSELGATADEIKQIIAVLGPVAGALKEGQKVRVLLAAPGLGRVLPLRVMIGDDNAIEAAAALSDTGTYVPVDIGNVDTDIAVANADRDSGEDAADSAVSLYQSLYQTALRDNIPKSVIEEIVSVFAYDVDFQRRVKPGDGFDVLYAQDANGDGSYEVRYVSLDVGGEIKKYYHFRANDDGMYDYYDDAGKSARKFLVRKPVVVGVETSPFGWRVHPLLHIKEMHTGVDWGAPIGTPIFAAGNGMIEEIGTKGGYGKYVRIRHADGYETAYGHLSAFARGLEVGSHVRQGQVIGFLGSTGLSTGAHVHFEILLNGRFVDPMRVKLPRGRVLDGNTLAQFEKDRNELDLLLAGGSPARLAQAH